MFSKLRLKKLSKKQLKIIGLLLLLLYLPLILSTLYFIQDARSRAALPDRLESESGVLSNSGVTKQSDSGASGGSFVLFNKTINMSPTPTSSPSIDNEIVGYGKNTTGGKGGELINVKSAFEFKAALEKSGTRTVVMDVPYPTVWTFGKAAIKDNDDNLTVICDPDLIIRGSYILIDGGDNIIIDGCAVGTGDEASVEVPDDWDAISISGYNNPVENVVLINNTMRWGPDVTVAVIGSVSNVTIQNNIIAEGLKYSRHSEAIYSQPYGHSYGLNVSELGGTQNRITITRNLLSRHGKGRTPQIVGGSNIEFTNNYIYGWGRYAGDGDPESLNFTNNYLEPSDASITEYAWRLTRLDDGTHSNSVWVNGNIIVGNPNDYVENPNHIVYRNTEAFTPSHTQMTATQAKNYVLEFAGGVRNLWEKRIVDDVINKESGFYNGEGEAAPNPYWPL